MRLFSLLLVVLLFCAACKKDDDEVQKEGNCLTATIDGEAFEAETTTGTFITKTVDYEDRLSQETRLLTINGIIAGLTSDTEIITLTFACSEFSSKLDIVNTDPDCGIIMSYQTTNILNPASSKIIFGMEGEINVEEETEDRIRATFNFKGEDQDGNTVSISDGFFDTTISR